MRKRILSLSIAVALAVTVFAGMFGRQQLTADAAASVINNAALMPKWVPDSEVQTDANGTPDWVQTLVMGAIHVNTATEEGTLEAAIKVLDHYAEMGVNGIWVCPVYEPDKDHALNGYENLGPQSIDPDITGVEPTGDKSTMADYQKGWEKLKWFVDEAHKRNIRIILDVISWGVGDDSPLLAQHPMWFNGDNGSDGWYFNYNNDEFVEWYVSQVVNIAMVTGCDGFRYDTEPQYAGYKVDGAIREQLIAKGRKMFMISERENERGGVYDAGQTSITVGVTHDNYKSLTPNYFMLDQYNIVDSVKKGENIGTVYSQELYETDSYRYYTNCITNHDNTYPVVQGNRAALGYQAYYSPFIPVLYLGEEFNNTRDDGVNGPLFFNPTHWELLDKPENRAFFEDVKAMIRIRRQYPEIFAYYPEQFKDSNICKVNVTGCEVSQPYARYAGDTAMLIIPNYNLQKKDAKMTVYLPFTETGLDYYSNYVVTDAETGKVVVSGSASKVAKFTVEVPYEDQRVFMVKATGKIQKAEHTVSQPTVSSEISGNAGTVSDTMNNESSSVTSDDSTSSEEASSEEVTSSEQESSKTQYEEETVVIRRKKDSNKSGFPVWAIILIVCGVVAAAAGVVVTLVVMKKKKAGKA